MKYTGTSTRAKPQGRVAMYNYCIKYEDFSCYNMCYITTTPYLLCNNKNINRKELYDFYYTAITLTTGYKYVCIAGNFRMNHLFKHFKYSGS